MSTQQTPTQETPTQETPTQETPTQETPTPETPTQQTPTPKLFIQMSGAPGAGKTTIAELVATAIHGVVINHDSIHDAVRSSLINPQVPFRVTAKHAYRFQWMVADTLMQRGYNIIIDSPCNSPEVLEEGAAIAEDFGYTYWYVECKVEDINLLDQRLRTRPISLRTQRTGVNHPPASDPRVNGQNYRSLFRRWIEHPCRPQDNVVVVDSSTEDLDWIRDCIVGTIIGH